MEAVIGDCPAIHVSEDVSEREFDVCTLGFTDPTERPVVDVEYADGIVPVPVLPKENQRFSVFISNDDSAGWQIKPLERDSDSVLRTVLTNDVEMYTFHHEIGVIDKAGECPGEHLLLPIEVGGVDLDNECGVCARDVWDLVL